MSLSALRNKNRGTAKAEKPEAKPKEEPKPEMTAAEQELAELKAKLAAAEEAAKEPEVKEAELFDTADEKLNTKATEKPEPKKTKQKAGKGYDLATVGSLGELVKAGASGGAMSAFLDEEAKSNFEVLFPFIQHKSGDAGAGGFLLPDSAETLFGVEVADALPCGPKPISCFLLGYRMSVLAWGMDYDERSEGDGPVWGAAIPASAVEDVTTLAAATKKYNYTAKANKTKFDWNNGEGPGRPSPTLELLVYRDGVGLMVIRTPSVHNSVALTMGELVKNLCDDSGAITPAPVRVSSAFKSTTTNSRTYKNYYFEVSLDAQGGAKTTESFQAFASEIDDETNSKYKDWIECSDNPITDEVREKLKQAANV